ncbi:MAG: phospho-sugar mutase, partial [Planctomycetaceae bacterium]
MAELGSATMNARTVCESASGIARYLQQARGTSGGRGVIAYDSRHRSREFAELTARTWAAAGLKVFLFDGARSTPELSFAVRQLRCDVGVMISASHNPPADNGVKAYWSTGGQVLPPHDRGIIEAVYQANEIPLADLEEARAAGQVELVGEELDEYYINAVTGCGLSKARQVTAVYSPLHGVGETSVFRVLQEAGFEGVSLYAPQATQDGAFPKVPQQLPNPERPEVYEPLIEAARKTKADLVLASDPDADRLGVAVRDGRGRYIILSGNRVGALLADYVLRKRKGTGTLGKGSFLVQTLVTTPLIPVIAEKYKVTVFGDLMVGFKYIGQVIDREGAQRFLLGCEESLGYLAGGYARDKDAAVAALLMAEQAAALKAVGRSPHELLDELFVKHGCHLERTINVMLPGATGMGRMKEIMAALRATPPKSFGGLDV